MIWYHAARVNAVNISLTETDVIYAPLLVISSSCRLNSCGLRAFSVLGPRLWNSLPRLLRDIATALLALAILWRHSFSQCTSAYSPLGALATMRYKSTFYLLTYLLNLWTSLSQPRSCPLTRVTSLKVLAVTVSEKLSVTHQSPRGSVDDFIKSRARSMYAVSVLRTHDMCAPLLQQSVVILKLTYAAPARQGFSTSADRLRVESFLRRTAWSRLWESPISRNHAKFRQNLTGQQFKVIQGHQSKAHMRLTIH